MQYIIQHRLHILIALLLIGMMSLSLRDISYSERLANRSIQVSTSVPSAQAVHNFSFDIVTPGLLGSIELEYCSNDPFIGTACVAPAGLSLSGASLTFQSGETGFMIHPSSTANRIVLSRTPTVATPQPAAYRFGNVINPSTANESVYVRISTFASDDATGSRIDTGAVVFSTSGGLGTIGYVPPHLTLCVGISVNADCSGTVGTSLNLGELSTQASRAGISQFAVATNDPGGYSLNLLGTTMTSGNNIIPPLIVPSFSNPGTSQFGINLRANTNPSIGQNRQGPGSATVHPDYDLPNQFTFKSSSNLVSSSVPTDFNTFTVSYLVNISSAQPPGVYSTTATFLATAAF